MAVEQNLFDQSYTAFGDFRSTPFYFVEFVADKTVQKCSAATAVACGVIQNNPNSGQTAVVRHAGVTKVMAGALISAAGYLIGTAAHGAAIREVLGTNSANYILGVGQEDAVSGAIFSMIMASVPARAL
jgi:predicted membrane protein